MSVRWSILFFFSFTATPPEVMRAAVAPLGMSGSEGDGISMSSSGVNDLEVGALLVVDDLLALVVVDDCLPERALRLASS